jgi:hypothetical protein
MEHDRPNIRRTMPPAVFVVLAVALVALHGAPARASSGDKTATTIGRYAAQLFLGVSGYWFTHGSALRGLGSPKFGGSTTLYVKEAHRGRARITGGIELAGATDHWLPFTGSHSSFSLTGVSGRVSTERKLYRLAPFVSAGVFNGHVHSEKLGLSKDQIVPSAAIGVHFKVHRYVSLSARYRFTPAIAGVNTSGFGLGLSFF